MSERDAYRKFLSLAVAEKAHSLEILLKSSCTRARFVGIHWLSLRSDANFLCFIESRAVVERAKERLGDLLGSGMKGKEGSNLSAPGSAICAIAFL